MPDAPEDPDPVPQGALIRIDDPGDPRLDLYRRLDDPAGRIVLESEESVFVVEGRLAVERLLTSRYTMRSLLVDDRQVEAAGGLVAATRAKGVPVYVATRAVVAGTVGFALHRGVVAVATRPAPSEVGPLLADAVGTTGDRRCPPLVCVLEGLNDHENIGALFRNAAAFGVAGVLLDPTCADPLYRRSVRVSVGHVLQVPFARIPRWPGGLDQLRAVGFMIAAMALHPVGDLPGVDLAGLSARMTGPGRPAGLALLLGSEGSGLSEEALAASDLVVTIPMATGVDSLNVATAAAVAFHALTTP